MRQIFLLLIVSVLPRHVPRGHQTVHRIPHHSTGHTLLELKSEQNLTKIRSMVDGSEISERWPSELRFIMIQRTKLYRQKRVGDRDEDEL